MTAIYELVRLSSNRGGRSSRIVLRTAFSALSACIVGALIVTAAASSSTRATNGPQGMTLYSLVKSEQFLNTKDDRQRGIGSSPFGNYKDLTPTTRQNHKGALAGDYEMFKLAVYKSATLKQPVGSAVYTCSYGFNLIAFCNTTYELNDGTLLGAGLVDFNLPNFAIAVTGGTGKYRGLKGDIHSATAARHAQRLLFVFK